MALHTPFSLLWSVLALSLALFLVANDPRPQANRALARFFMAIGWWAFCEFLWNNAETPALALRWLHLGMPGFLPLGGLYLIFALSLTDHEHVARRKSVACLAYGVPVIVGLVAIGGVPLFDRVKPMPWGWGYHPAPLYLVYLAYLVVCFSWGIAANLRHLRSTVSRRAQRRGRILLLATIIPIMAGTLTDAALPLLDIQVFRVASLSATVMLGLFIYAMVVYREPLVSPETVSSEILATIPDAVLLIDQHGRLRHANAAAAGLTGYPSEKLMDMPISNLINVPEGMMHQPGEITGTFSNIHNAEVLLRTAEGERVPIALSTSIVTDDTGDMMGLVGVARDLRALKQLQLHVSQNSKLAALGRLASGIGHEINNPITYVSMNLRTLRKEVQALEGSLAMPGAPEEPGEDTAADTLARMSELLDESSEGASRIHEIVRNMRQYSLMGTGKVGRTQLRAEVASALRVAHPEIKHRAEVHVDLAELPPVLASASDLQQVLVNLLINATQAIEGYGNIRIRTSGEKGWAAI
ncbi:MAG: histidine kinase N-terminal 7TM domain-containing protein, partial [Myxococcota bacterium]